MVADSNCLLCKNPKSSAPYFGGPTVEPELLNSYIEEVDGAEDTCPLCNTVLKDLNTVLVSENEVISFEKPKYYRCTICNSGFSTQTKVTKHACRQLHTTVCPECNRQFNSKKRLVFHLQSHIDPSMTLRCDVCMLTFNDETTCYDHVRFSHESETLCCDTCGKTYITRIGLSMHQMYHDDVRKFKCSDCGKRFLNQATLKEHRVSHLNVKPFQCDICGKSLSRASRLRIHLKVHSARNSTNFQKCHTCKSCGFVSFSSERLLEHNVKTHNNSENDSKTSILHKLYRCEFCDNCYEMPSLLHSHRETHAPDTTENPFVCGLCNGYFKTYSRLVTHKLSHGINTETHILQISASLESSDSFIIPQYFCCKYCDKLYEQYTAYNIHMKHSKHFVPKDKSSPKRSKAEEVVKVKSKSSPKPRSTTVTEKKYKQREIELAVQSLNKENIPPVVVKESKPVVRVLSNLEKLICCKCGKNFASEKLLRIHENRHNPRRKRKTYSCEDCPRFFASKSELRKHENVHHKPQLMCENCGKEFRYKGWYSLHVDNKVCFRTDEDELPEELKTNLPFTDIINRILLF
ncbi:zinc finger protein 91-like [Planococcus citri]|uniref:zinc finger protein 91-like n=1 Tax=Planococcus citri TaxID=170843 RepID=UPI0031F9B29A